jgi:hypothetical protein
MQTAQGLLGNYSIQSTELYKSERVDVLLFHNESRYRSHGLDSSHANPVDAQAPNTRAVSPDYSDGHRNTVRISSSDSSPEYDMLLKPLKGVCGISRPRLLLLSHPKHNLRHHLFVLQPYHS